MLIGHITQKSMENCRTFHWGCILCCILCMFYVLLVWGQGEKYVMVREGSRKEQKCTSLPYLIHTIAQQTWMKATLTKLIKSCYFNGSKLTEIKCTVVYLCNDTTMSTVTRKLNGLSRRRICSDIFCILNMSSTNCFACFDETLTL